MSRLPPRPDDSYDWDRFFGDQTAIPLLFHGTSTVHEESIRRRGLAFSSRPYDSDEIRGVVEILEKRELYGERGELGVLSAYTAGTAQDASISLTFDWTRACRYALLNRGGETLEYLIRMLEWSLQPEQVAALTSSERGVLGGILERVLPMVKAHQPLVVAAEMPREWYGEMQFFGDRAAFEASRHDVIRGKPRYLGLHIYPDDKRSSRIGMGGHEFRVEAVTPDQVRRYVRLSTDQALVAHIRTVT